MNLEQTRFNMVEQQIRPWDVLDPEVIKLLFELRREEFVPPAHYFFGICRYGDSIRVW